MAVGDADGDGDLDVYCMARADGSNPNDYVMLNNGASVDVADGAAAGG